MGVVLSGRPAAIKRGLWARLGKVTGIHLLPFCKDDKNWNQLLDVMEEFAREIPASQLLMSQKAKEMKNLLYAPT